MQAAILQSAADYINTIEKQNGNVCKENAQLKEILNNLGIADIPSENKLHNSPPLKRPKRDTGMLDPVVLLV